MDTEDVRHLETLRQITKNRLRLLEIQQTRFGYNTPPEVNMEIEELTVKLNHINDSLIKGIADTKIDLEYLVNDLADAVNTMIQTDLTIVSTLPKMRRSIEGDILAQTRGVESVLLSTMILMLVASLYTDKIEYILIIGIIPVALSEILYYIFVRPKQVN
jgi:hypothetical protein